MAGPWRPFGQLGEFQYDAAGVRRAWERLHGADAEPLPADPAVLEAWVLFHNGEFQRAHEAGLAAGPAGTAVANKAACIHANYLEHKDKRRQDLLLAAAQRAEQRAQAQPEDASAWYWQAYALGRYSQGISVAKALAHGYGGKVKDALERTIALQPRHVDAHVALGTFHAEVIDKVGTLIGGMTYGARKDAGLAQFEQALRLLPAYPIALVEYARALLMLEGERHAPEARRLLEQAAAARPADAHERLQVECARAELQH